MKRQITKKLLQSFDSFISTQYVFNKDIAPTIHPSASLYSDVEKKKKVSCFNDPFFQKYANKTSDSSAPISLSASFETSFDDLQVDKDTFSTYLLHLIDERKLKDSDVYNRAGITRQHFSKIRSNHNYSPKKETVFMFIIVLQLREEEARKLLGYAGYTFSMSYFLDLTILFCVKNKIFDPFMINDLLDRVNVKPLFFD